MTKRYTRINWQNAPSTATPVNAENLNTMDKGIADAHSQLAQDAYHNRPILEMPESYLSIPSAIGNSLTTHPSIVDFGEGQYWNGYRYWLAHTPYPGTANENPSIAVSNDNKVWAVPEGAPNPLVQAPAPPAYNSDVELVYMGDINKLRLYYREYGLDSKVRLYFIESSDGSIWTTPTLSLETEKLAMSPAIIKDTTEWKMWTVENGNTINYHTSSDGISWSAGTVVNNPFVNWNLWHIGIKKDTSGKYHMLASTYPDNESGEGTQFRTIIYANSDNGLTWNPIEKPQLIPVGWAGGYLYRPSFYIDESKGLKDGLPYVKMWFSASDDAIAAGWHIGYCEGYLMSGDSNPSATSEKIKRKRMGEYFKLFASNIIAPFAKISRLKTKRIEVTSDFSQPLVEFRDGRVGRNGGNYLRKEYIGSEDKTLIRKRIIITNDDGEQFVITLQPFTNNNSAQCTFSSPTTLSNVLQLIVEEVIAKKNIQIRNEGKINRILTNSAGNLILQITGGGGNYNWTYRGDGQLDAGNNGAYNQAYIGLTPQTARPMHLTSSRSGIYLANGTTHDPLNLNIGSPYLVYWDGSAYSQITAQSE